MVIRWFSGMIDIAYFVISVISGLNLMKIISANEIFEAAACLAQGGLVAFPTETVYGLGTNAFDPVAVARIFETKQRPTFDPLIVHIADIKELDSLFANPIDPLVYRLAEAFMPGPLTIVHRKAAKVPEIVTAGLENVAVRMPSNSVARKLIEAAKTPVAAPSANRFGQLSPTSYRHVIKQNMNIDYLIAEDDNCSLVGIESTVVMVENGQCAILRPGIITADDIMRKIPDIEVFIAKKNEKISSPGLLNSHYSPLKPLYFYNNEEKLPENSALILHCKSEKKIIAKKLIYTSENGNLLEVAAHLFECLHTMEDDNEITQIFIAKVDETGIGLSIMDRLKKATFQYRS